MAKQRSKKQKQDDALHLGDRLDGNVFAKLKEKQKELQAVEKQREEEEKQRRIQERKEREKNKSFEELFEESNLDWRKYK
ncbi:YqkE family protein [Bacillus tianshenii]|nr:YqkE family protein [Bacillus tianshenii]